MMMTSPLVIGCTWLYRMAWLNFAWLFMTLIGGVVFGILPATVVTSIMIRRYLNGVVNISIREFWKQFCLEFKRTNKTGWILLLPLLALIWWASWIVNNMGTLSVLISMALMPIAILVASLLFTTLIQMSIYQTQHIYHDIQNGMKFLFGQPKTFLLTIVVFLFCVALIQIVPITVLFFSVSPPLLTAITIIWWNDEQLQLIK